MTNPLKIADFAWSLCHNWAIY